LGDFGRGEFSAISDCGADGVTQAHDAGGSANASSISASAGPSISTPVSRQLNPLVRKTNPSLTNAQASNEANTSVHRHHLPMISIDLDLLSDCHSVIANDRPAPFFANKYTFRFWSQRHADGIGSAAEPRIIFSRASARKNNCL
jgi:hypothetical protein